MTEAPCFTQIRWAGLDLFVTAKTFVPRESSIVLLDIAKQLSAREAASARTLVDMCCGSGALGLSVYRSDPARFNTVVFLDASADAVISAEANLARYAVPGRVQYWRAGEEVPCLEPAFVLCNPPFLEEAANRDLPAWQQFCVTCPQNGLEVISDCFKSIAGSRHFFLLKSLPEQISAAANLRHNTHHLVQVHNCAPDAAFSVWAPTISSGSAGEAK